MSYYAVANGRTPGIYRNWDACRNQIHKFSNAQYKKFDSQDQAQEFMKAHGVSFASSSSSSSSTLGNGASCQDSDSSDNEYYGGSQRSYSTYKGYTFDTDSYGYVNVYTDGACSSNGYAGARAGIGVYFGDNHPLNVSQPVIGRATNNMAEIQAVTVALQQARKAGITKININTDSQFLINCINVWMPKWKKNGWCTGSGKQAVNKQELIEMENAMKGLNVRFMYVPGHAGVHGNEMADKLACEGATRYRA